MNFLELSLTQVALNLEKFKTQLTVIGLGKMGVPLSMVFTNAGFHVQGYDISDEVVDSLNDGSTSLKDEPDVGSRLMKAIEEKKFKAFTDFNAAVAGSAFIFIIIPILTDENNLINLEAIKQIYQQLETSIDPGTTIIQESTLPPGTTTTILRPILEKNGKKSGVDFGLVFSPERTFSGRVIEDIEKRYPKLVGGDTSNASDLVVLLYEQVAIKGVIKLSNATTAEAVKTFKGAYRDANIAIANQLAILADLINVDILEVIEAANSEPSSHIHRPGIGVGGHCIPVYPQFLIELAKEKNFIPSLFVNSRKVNDEMVEYCINKLKQETALQKSKILVLGLAYRGGVKEARNSPSLRLVPDLRAEGAIVKVYDPLFTKTEIDTIFGKGTHISSLTSEIEKQDIIIIATDHDEFQGMEPELTGKFVFDGRYVLKPELCRELTLMQPGRFNLQY